MRKLLISISLSLALIFTTIAPVIASEINQQDFNTTTNISAESTISTKVTKVTLNKKSLTLGVGTSETLIPTITPSTATNQNVTWKSSKTSVATVDSNGTVTAIKNGTAVITVTTEDGKKRATCRVKVDGPKVIKVSKVILNKKSTSICVGDNETLTVKITPTNATNQNVTWSSSNTDVATVDQNGTVEGKSLGATVVTVTTEDGNKKASCNVTVKGLLIITSIDNITKNINQGDNYTLPQTVEAKMSDNSKKQVAVTWNPSTVDTSKAGTFTFYGDVEGYNKQVVLTLAIKPIPYSRLNPAPLNTTQTINVKDYFDDYTAETTVKNIIRGTEAWNKIYAANKYNSPPKDGYEYILAKINFKLLDIKDGKSLSLYIGSFKLVSENNSVYDDFYYVDEPDPAIDATLYKGASVEGWEAFLVKKDDLHPKIVFGEKYDGTGGIWFQAYNSSSTTILSISPINITTIIGTAPVLPSTVTATMSDGTTQIVAVTWASLTPSQYGNIGSFVLTGTIANSTMTATANINVIGVVPATVQYITIVPPSKTTYDMNEALDTSGMKVIATYSDSTYQDVTSQCSNNFNSSTAGSKFVTVSFQNKTAAFVVTIKNTVQIELIRQQYLSDLANLKTILDNTKANKCVQQMTKLPDGTWGFVYVADQAAVDRAQRNYDAKYTEYQIWEANN